jgi:diacylglycerol kinase (ATP)
VNVVINPVAGQPEPILHGLNAAFKDSGVEWNIALTQATGDALRLAKEAAADGVDAVAVYGGDDTVAEVAAGLSQTGVPMGILRGGTANVLANELLIPNDLREAAEVLLADAARQKMDLGRAAGRVFTVRTSTGVLAEMILGAEREAKTRLGELAYIFAGIRAAVEPKPSVYQLTVDGVEVEIEAVGAFVANCGNLALRGVSIAPEVQIDDGMLDVIFVRQLDLKSILSIAASAAAIEGLAEPLPRWQGREITLLSDPPRRVAIDGEPGGQTPVIAELIPAAIEIIVPAPDGDAGASEVEAA